MKMTPIDFIHLEFPDETQMTPQEWLRKMQEFAVIQNAKTPIEHLLELSPENKKALNYSISALYFYDSKDYRSELFEVAHNLTKINKEDLDEQTISEIYSLLNPE